MKLEEIYVRLEGYNLLKTVQHKLGVNRQQAIYYIHRLRKAGYVETTRNPTDGKRLYKVSRKVALGGTTYEDVISEYTPVKLHSGQHIIHGRKPSIEETIVHAMKEGSIRKVIAAVWLFNRVNDWSLLYRLAKQADVVVQVAAVYDAARRVTRTRRMPKRFRNLAKKQIKGVTKIGGGYHSRHFNDIEDDWQVNLPFNQEDFRGW